MKKLIALVFWLTAAAVVASVVVIFDPPTGRIVRVIPSADTLQYIGASNALINPVFPTNDIAQCMVTNGVIIPKPDDYLVAEFQTASNATVLARDRFRSNTLTRASRYMQTTDAEGRMFRAFALLTLDQLNTLRRTNGMSIITTNVFLNALSNAVINDPR